MAKDAKLAQKFKPLKIKKKAIPPDVLILVEESFKPKPGGFGSQISSSDRSTS